MSPPPPRCPSRLSRRRASLPVQSVTDALDVVASVTADPVRHQTVALVMDASRRGGTCLVVDGTDALAAISEVAEFVLNVALQQASRVDSVVLASVRPGRLAPDDGDHWRWFELRDRFDEAGIDLLDWLVVGDLVAVSMAQLTDSRSLW